MTDSEPTPADKDELQRTKEEVHLSIERARKALDILLRAVLMERQSSDANDFTPGPVEPPKQPEPPSPKA